MYFRWTTWGVGLLCTLALSACVGDDTPTPEGPNSGIAGSSGAGGAGGAGNDASLGSDTSTGKSGGSGSDSGSDAKLCMKTTAMAVTGQDIGECKAAQAEGGADSGGDAGAACFACLCGICPKEAKTCGGDPNCKEVNDCCRAACNCGGAATEGGSDAPTGDANASTTDSPAGDGAAE